ncbi:MAG: hypothetical protein Kow0070_20170 [Anaerolineales bacterium]
MEQRFIRSTASQRDEVPVVESEGLAMIDLDDQPAAGSEALAVATSQALDVRGTNPRKVWLDYLRVFAILAVITGHVIADFYGLFGKVGAAEWWLSNVLGILARSAVPVFVMVSGALLLGKSYSIGAFYKKRALRLIPPIIFWNLVYLGVYIRLYRK